MKRDESYSPNLVREGLGLSYDDVLLIPKRGVLNSRSEADLTTELIPDLSIGLPILSAPMTSVTEESMAVAMDSLGGVGVLHRFADQDARLDMVDEVSVYTSTIAAAIGLKDDPMFLTELVQAGANVLVLDVAHAHCDPVIEFVKKIKSFPSIIGESSLVVGNIATRQAAHDFMQLGVHGLKVGIGPGAACTTREVTGFGVPQLTAVMEVANLIHLEYWNDRKKYEIWPTVIADGGIKSSGDIVKALAAGADSVMIGHLLAGSDEAPYPGDYFGMASGRVNGHKAPEGVEGHVERTGPVEETIKQLAWGIRSGLSYAGARNLNELRRNAEWVRVAPGVAQESRTRL